MCEKKCEALMSYLTPGGVVLVSSDEPAAVEYVRARLSDTPAIDAATLRKPFDLEAAKCGKPIVTRDGKNARFIAHTPEAEQYKVVAFIEGNPAAAIFKEDGSFYESKSKNDLFMLVQKKTVYVNLRRGGIFDLWNQYDSAEDAKRAADNYPGASRPFAVAVPVEIEA